MKSITPKIVSFLSLLLALALFMPLRAAADDDDPPSRVARLALVNGSVSFNPAGTDDWVSAVVNRPMTTGDKLWSDADSRAELNMGSATLRLGATTGFNFLNLDDATTQIQLTEGTLRIRVKRLDQNETFEIDTPNLAFSILRPGTYRISVNENGDATLISVRGGEGEVTGGGQAYTIHANESASFAGTDQLNADVQGLADPDDFDNWCNDRDRREDHSTSSRYVSPDVIGYEDLDENGGWRPVPEYGQVWFPHVVIAGWAPYHYGHWAYIEPWGYTWVDDAPWGFAPFHYGRWVNVGGVWGWVPAPVAVVGVAYVRPVYAPALVAWVGGPHFAVGVGVGAAVNVGWFPLGPREVFVPSYRVSRTYVNNVNISNTRVNVTVVNNYYNTTVVNKQVVNVRYVNQGVSGAVSVTSRQAFTTAQPVAHNNVRFDQREVATAQVSAGAPAIVPQRQAVVGAGRAENVRRPPATVVNRTVVAKTAPPPAPVSFERRQQAIQANGGQPIAKSQARQLATANAAAAPHSNVKLAPPDRPAPAQTQNNNANRPGQPNNRPPAANAPVQQQPNANQPANTNRNVTPNSPNNQPAVNNAPRRNDRPPAAQPTAPAGNPQLERKQQQQTDQLRNQQDQERQRVERQQEQQHQNLNKQKADDQKKQQTEQQHQQQLEQLEQKHNQQEQQLQQRQQAERQNSRPAPPPKNEKGKDNKDNKDKDKNKPH
ncbi:MAG TPA: DUF6600 domain-containing protein [Candidatus Acidoferrum sp.]|jgi:hypothetical protein